MVVAMGGPVVLMRISHLLLWLEMLIIHSTWPLIGYAQHTSLPEVVTPLQVLGNRTMWAMGWLTYSLHFGGQRHFISMKAKKFLVSRHFSLFTYTDQGTLHENQPFIKKDCYYHGYVDGDPESMVALTTCFGGFQGMLQVNGTVYEIKPKNLSSTSEHLVHKIESKETELLSMRCALTEEELARQMKLREKDNPTLMQSNYEGWWTHKHFLELALVVDHERIRYHNNNISRVLVETFLIVHVINEIYRTLGVEVVLHGVEMWNKGNPFEVNTIEDLLQDFCLWKTISINNRIPNDIAHLFVNHYFGINLGLAYVGTVCSQFLNCGVDRLMGRNLVYVGHIAAHEMGHNLGMLHDDVSCTCGAEACLMSATDNGIQKFSNCSYAAFWRTYATTTCMRKEKKPISKHKFCGNGVVDDGEQCDCGSYKRCIADPCCQLSCTLKDGSACAFGLCCKHCQIMPAGTVCRENNSECDLPEWCNGHSYECPSDVYLLDGSPCKDGGYCYGKRCNNREDQCQQIFGKEARSAAEGCYRKINTQGDRFGNCGISKSTYLRCNDSDVLCGRVQCEDVMGIPVLEDHSTVHCTHFNGVTCWGTDYHFGMTMPDIGSVKDGADCGPEHVCINKKCVHKSVWASPCSSKTCNMKGVCNNLHHCHCNVGWDPPYCLESGFGGSVDSGPPAPNSGPPILDKEKHKKIKNIAGIILLLIFLIIFLHCIWYAYIKSRRSKESNVSAPENEEEPSGFTKASSSS